MRLLRALGLIAFLAAGAAAGAVQAASLTGKVLVASEGMPDPRFQETVILLVNHDANGALGLVVNKPSAIGPIAALLDELGIEADEYGFDVQGSVTLHYGGPVEPDRGFILHSADYEVGRDPAGLQRYRADLQLRGAGRHRARPGPAPQPDYFRLQRLGAIATGRRARARDWTVTDADPDLVLGTDHESKWRRSLGGIII